MKKIISTSLAALMLAGVFVSCAPASDQLDPAITLASSDAAKYAEWLGERLDAVPDDIVMGIGSSEEYGIDMTNFDADGYIARTIDGQAVIFGKTESGLDRAVREYAKSVDAGTNAELDTVYGEGAWIESLTIGGHDISEFTVVAVRDGRSDQPSIGATFDNAKTAADELVRLIEKACGVTLPIVDEGTESGEHFIRIGYLPDDGTYGEQSFTYEVKDGDLLINGMAKTNGCLNAVYYFLEYELGWDGLMYGDSYLAESAEIAIGNGLTVECDPMFDFFTLHRFYDNEWQTSRQYEYKGKTYVACHGIQGNGGYGFEESMIWPEGGICYTGEVSVEYYYEGFLNRVSKMVASGYKIGEDYFFQDISHPDSDQYCMCSTCKNVYRKEGNAKSGLVVNFANMVVERMKEDGYGGLKWGVFAYCGSNKPCKTAPDKDVYLTFCTDFVCVNHPLTGEDCFDDIYRGSETYDDYYLNNNLFAEWLAGWTSLTNNLFIWHYALFNNNYDYTMFYSLYDDFHLMYDHNVKGMFWEAEYKGIGLGRLRFELVGWMQWHPDATEAEYELARNEIMEREYGDGWEYVLDMIALWRENEINAGCYHCWNFGYHVWLPDGNGSDVTVYAKNSDTMYELLELARDQALNAQQDKNIALLQMDVAIRQCYTTYFKAYEENDTETLAHLDTRFEQFVELVAFVGFDINNFPVYHPTYVKSTFGKNLEETAWFHWGDGQRVTILTAYGMTPEREKPQQYIGLETATES